MILHDIRPIWPYLVNIFAKLALSDVSHMTVHCAMWETTFPRLTHAGLDKPINEDNMRSSMHNLYKRIGYSRLSLNGIFQQ